MKTQHILLALGVVGLAVGYIWANKNSAQNSNNDFGGDSLIGSMPPASKKAAVDLYSSPAQQEHTDAAQNPSSPAANFPSLPSGTPVNIPTPSGGTVQGTYIIPTVSQAGVQPSPVVSVGGYEAGVKAGLLNNPSLSGTIPGYTISGYVPYIP